MTSSTSRNDERIESSALQLLDGCIASHRAGELEEWELQLVRRRLLQSESGLNQSHEQPIDIEERIRWHKSEARRLTLESIRGGQPSDIQREAP
jgi:hypothetical protein